MGGDEIEVVAGDNQRVDVAAMIDEAPSADGQKAGNPLDNVNDNVSFHHFLNFYLFIFKASHLRLS